MRRQKIETLMLAVTCSFSLFPATVIVRADTNTSIESSTNSEENQADDTSNAILSDDSNDAKTAVSDHEPITMQVPYRNITTFVDMVHEQYPEINLEFIPYNGANMTTYLTDELKSGDMPDIYVTTNYVPGRFDLSEHLIDLSSYSFTNNYSEIRLREVSDNGAIYLLPTYFTCLGITYNKTLLEENGWELPNSLEELRELAPKVKEAGYNLALTQIALPGYGFQYLCNILDMNGKTTVADSPDMKEALSVLDTWKELGLLNADGDLKDDDGTKKMMAEGNTLFMLGSTNVFGEGESECEFGLMPYLSEDGTQNALILNISRYVGLNKRLEEPGNEQKLDDALHVMEVLSTVEGMRSLNEKFANTSLLPLHDYEIPEDSYYKQVEDDLNSGATAPFIYSGWENLVVPVGNVVIDYIKGEKTLDDIIEAFDSNQHLIEDVTANAYTTVTEELSTDDCARLVGICFAKATGADLALISENKWYKLDENTDLNLNGVSVFHFQ